MEARVAEWRQVQCAKMCPSCPRNCCDGRLNPRLDPPDRFTHLPHVRPGGTRPLQGPYVADRRFLGIGSRFLVGPCPHLTEGRCGIYCDASRPRDCEQYPLHLQRVLGGLGGTVLHAEGSCWIFDVEAARRQVESLATELGVELMWHPRSS